MKVFYTTASIETENYKQTIKLLKKLLGNNNVSSPETRENIQMGEESDKVTKAVAQKEKQLKESDIVIADITDGTAGVGYFISTALYLKKPTLVLQTESDSMHEIHDSITAGKNRLLTYETYKNPKEDIEEIVKNFINNARQKLDTKFILIIPAEIDRYLEWASDNKRMHKAQIVRNAIEDYMQKDEDWKDFIVSE